MDATGVLETAGASLGARRVFSEPIEKDGAVVVFAAKVGGGGGGGENAQPSRAGEQTGSGLGFGLSAKPAGAFVLSKGKLRWRPAVDVNRVILGGQLVMVTALLVARSIVRARALRRRRFLFGRAAARGFLRRAIARRFG